ncbi:MAG: hypothetical protein GY799_29445 [Desulfobulbaceae bacterium]|nr:hypothetical protein [Desulfobulbaceae bacterium]
MEYPDNSRDTIDVYNDQGHYDGEPFTRLDKPRTNEVYEQGDRQTRDSEARTELRTPDEPTVQGLLGTFGRLL